MNKEIEQFIDTAGDVEGKLSDIEQSLKMRKWLEKGEYLPPIMRDFHDAKRIFKTIQTTIIAEEKPVIVRRPDFIEAQCYVIDVFLWYMAKHGYTLQKSRAKLEFRDLISDIEQCEQKRCSEFAEFITHYLNEHKKQNA